MRREFKLGGVTWRVKVDNDKMADAGALGVASYQESTIYLASKSNGKFMPADYIEQTFYHELTHAMLDALGYNELSEDETFVQGLGLLLHQYTTTVTTNSK